MGRERHLFIAGTGRAGTSFLVRFLTEIGLDTSLSRLGDKALWDEQANAGLEEALTSAAPGVLPYVIKSPWLYRDVDTLLADHSVAIDAVIIPVRDLAEAASSRVVLERRAIHETNPWTADLRSTVEEWGCVAGGVVYSLNPIDQGRLLAVGFHHLLQRLVAADVPVILLAFPRLVSDPDYLLDRLRPVLPPDIDQAEAIAAHRRVADASKVRIGEELRTALPNGPVPFMRYRSGDTLDAIAMKREIRRLQSQLADARDAVARHDQQAHDGQIACQDLQRECDHLQRECDHLQRECDHLQRERDQLYRSRSWLLTQPYRAIGLRLRRLLHKA